MFYRVHHGNLTIIKFVGFAEVNLLILTLFKDTHCEKDIKTIVDSASKIFFLTSLLLFVPYT